MTDLLDPAPVAAKDAPVDPAVGRSGVGAFFAYWLFTSLYPTLRLATRSRVLVPVPRVGGPGPARSSHGCSRTWWEIRSHCAPRCRRRCVPDETSN